MHTPGPDEPAAPEVSLPPVVQRLRQFAERQPGASRVVAFCRKHQRYAPLVFFLGGVTLDVLTLERVDRLGDNLILLTHLTLLTTFIILTGLDSYGQLRHPWAKRYSHWLPAATQVVMGALFSAYVIFYSQSASLTESAVYLGILAVLLVANEFIHRRQVNLYLLLSLYFLLAASYFVFLIPVLTKVANYATFTAGTLVGLGLAAGMVLFFYRRRVWTGLRHASIVAALVIGLFGALHLFYLQRWMPPVPLAMRFAGVFYDVERVEEGYRLRYEAPPWYKVWARSNDVLYYTPGEAVYCFTAIFAPTDLRERIVHRWRYFDADDERWVVMDRMEYGVNGGRGAGYRGYTYKRNLAPGRWEVDVQTVDGRVLGRLRFDLVQRTEGTPPVDTRVRLYQ
ncbi:MAG: DUF2914 domain-containing protein [Bacteroidota bacterium]